MGRSRAPRSSATVATLRSLAVCAALALLVSGCVNVSRETREPHPRAASSATGQRVHVVRPGETLYKIAWQYGVDQRDLQRWNGIRYPDSSTWASGCG